jgi:uncharacterized membrane protein YeaQ/YmgE (transglycosylase-associated protein family)
VTFPTFATWIAVAVVTAWGAGAVRKDGGHGLRADILLGLTGSGSACVMLWSIGMFLEPGIAATAIVAFAGASAVIAFQRWVFSAPPGKAHTEPGGR